MPVSSETALSSLTSMFGTPWTEEALDLVLSHHGGHVENTVETILEWGDRDPYLLIDRLLSVSGNDEDEEMAKKVAADMDEELAREMAQEQASQISANQHSQSRWDKVSVGLGSPLVNWASTESGEETTSSALASKTSGHSSPSSFFERSTASLNIADDERKKLL
eukprot:CAMPEP_0197443746 /NCGR_PEP_ID=MMETSP1175-20131217/9412_1 /TAXON_ID=1003142 /ORGANISM="Triceratium dubium, Strain CCMP147" /LENGTH=164 /DNA_ID=CAMNT_0042974423 /DNA_START=78 /DNA_END=572 /DNA_ORIENTATION=+